MGFDPHLDLLLFQDLYRSVQVPSFACRHFLILFLGGLVALESEHLSKQQAAQERPVLDQLQPL